MRRLLVSLAVSAATLLAVATPAALADGPPFAHQTSGAISLSTDSRDASPSVAVDANGTAYVAWIHTENAQQHIGYCRLPRGASACDTSLSFVAGSANNQLNQVKVLLLAPGDVTVLFTTTPGGGLYSARSTNGGATFTTTAVGATQPDDAIAGLGTGAAPIVSVTHTSAYGMYYATVPLNGSGAAETTLDAETVFFQHAGVGMVDSTTPIAAYYTGSDTHWRVFNSSTGVQYANAANWKPRGTLPGETSARLTSGVDGVFLQTLVGSGTDDAHYVVRHYNGASADSFGTPVTSSDTTRDLDYAQLYEDSAGGLHSAWWDNEVEGGGFNAPIRYGYSPDGGQTWYRRTLEDAPAEIPRQLQLAAAPDGGGLLVHDRLDSGGVVADIVPVPSTGGFDPPPAPPSDGGPPSTPVQPVITPPGACQTIAVTAKISARTSTGCWGKADAKGRRTTVADVRVNGIDFVNPSGKTITVDPTGHTLDVPKGVSAKAGAIVLHQPGADAFTWDFDKATAFPDVGAAGINLLGFPVTGNGSVTFGNQTAAVKVNIGLKPPFSAVSATPVLQTSMDKNLTLDGLCFDIAHVSVGPLLDINGIHICYQGSGSVFEGDASVALPTTGGSSSQLFSAKIGFAGGDLTHLDLAYSGPPLPLYVAPPAIFLDEIDFGLENHSTGLDVSGGVDFSGGPKLFGVAAIEVRGGLTLHIPTTGPVTLTADGKLRIADIPFGTASLTFSTAGKVSFAGGFNIDVLEPVIGISVSESGSIGVSPPSFQADAKASITLPGDCSGLICLSGSAEGVISSKGFGVCGNLGIGPASVSAGVVWPWASGPDPYLIGCQSNLKDVKLAGTRAVASRAAGGATMRALDGPQTVTVPAGLDQFDAVVQGDGGIPDVTVTGPGGRTISVGPAAQQAPVTGTSDMVGFGVPAITPEGYATRPPAAVVLIPKPPAGQYTITPNPGSAPIAAVLDAQGTPLPTTSAGSVSASSGGAGSRAVAARAAGGSRKRVVHVKLGPLNGHTVTLSEQGPGIDHPLGNAHVGANAVKFTIADGPAGPRKVVALIANDTGVATDKRTVATFVAPGPVRPGRPHVRLTRTRAGGLAITWKKVSAAKRYAVQVTLADGRKLQYATKAHAVTVPAVASTLTGKVSVIAQRGTEVSRTSTVTLKKVVAKKKKTKKHKPKKH